MNDRHTHNERAGGEDRELIELSILQLFNKVFNSALTRGELVTRKTVEDFFGTKDFDAVLKHAASLGVDGVVSVLNVALQRMFTDLRAETRMKAYLRRDRRAARRLPHNLAGAEFPHYRGKG
jgi:hypothetical protein